MSETCMCWGIDPGDGWYNLIDELCGFLQWQSTHNGYPQSIARQVKEKFGQLRFYAQFKRGKTVAGNENIVRQEKNQPGSLTVCPQDRSRSHEYLEGAIDFAETLSARICEKCGRPDALRLLPI
ncbi:MAG: hypothetical protein JXK94_08415 [Deltaproteobacteria bacterium]|nr:hypothetical protein [Deltaproteobacteria bacterium]